MPCGPGGEPRVRCDVLDIPHKNGRMDLRRLDDLPGRASSRALIGVLLCLVVVITLADLFSPQEVYVSPLLVIAPALAASFADPWRTAMIGLIAVGAEALIASLDGGLGTDIHVWQFTALVLLSALAVFFSYARQRYSHQLSRVRLVAETAQQVLLRPPPEHLGALRIAWRYLTADDDTQIGGDLFAVVRAGPVGSRVIVGDVRGKGLAAIGEASVVLGAFREGARRCGSLPDLVETLEESVARDLEDVADTQADPGEHFVTALLLDLPDHGDDARMVSCGHPPPLLLRARGVTVLHPTTPAPPLGLRGLPSPGQHTDRFTFAHGDMLLLYTDGVIEARSPEGTFYPLAERVSALPQATPDTLLQQLHDDLLAHTGGRLADDVALLAIARTPPPPADGPFDTATLAA